MSENKKEIAKMIKPYIKAPRNGKAFNDTIMKLDNIYRTLKTNTGRKNFEDMVLKYYIKYSSRHTNREPLNLDELEGGCMCKYSKFAKLEGGFLTLSDIRSGIDTARRLYNGVIEYAQNTPWTLELATKLYNYATNENIDKDENFGKIKAFYDKMKEVVENNKWSIGLAREVLRYVMKNGDKEIKKSDKPNKKRKTKIKQPVIDNMNDEYKIEELNENDENDYNLDDGEVNDLLRKLLNTEVIGNPTEGAPFKGRKKIRTRKRF